MGEVGGCNFSYSIDALCMIYKMCLTVFAFFSDMLMLVIAEEFIIPCNKQNIHARRAATPALPIHVIVASLGFFVIVVQGVNNNKAVESKT